MCVKHEKSWLYYLESERTTLHKATCRRDVGFSPLKHFQATLGFLSEITMVKRRTIRE